MVRVSIIIPFLNERENLPLLRARLGATFGALPGVEAEVVLVDDGSSDGSESYARAWVAQEAHAKYIRLSRNFGSHTAVAAGLAHCTGDCAVLLAADMQDPPAVISRLLDKWREGFEVVWAARSARPNASWHQKLSARGYYWLMRTLALPGMPAKGADFVLMGRKVIDAYNVVAEKNTSFLAIVLWLGFRQTTIEYVKQPRHAGTSKWTLSKKLKLLVDSVVSFSYAPIRLISLAGACVSFLGFLYALYLFIYAVSGNPVPGWSSLMIVVLLLGGFQLLMLGILGEYLWRAFDEARGRPRYVIEECLSSPEVGHSGPKRMPNDRAAGLTSNGTADAAPPAQGPDQTTGSTGAPA